MKKICLLIVLCLSTVYSFGTGYCVPAFANPCSSYPMNAAIGNLVGASGSIADTSSCTSASYEDRSALSCTLQASLSYSATLTLSAYYYSNFSVQVWVDFNDDSVFSSSESIGGGGSFSSTSPTITLSIPISSPTGVHKMRLVNNYSCCGGAMYPYIDPCPSTSISYGDARDYTVIISTPPPTITGSPSSVTFPPTTVSTSSAAATVVASAGYLIPASGSLTVVSTSAFHVYSAAAGTWVSSYTISYTSGTLTAVPLQVSFTPPSPTTYTGFLYVSGGGATTLAIPLNGIGATICSGTPTAGTAVVAPLGGSVYTPFTLSLSGYTTAGGLNFQWQSRNPTGSGSWANISGATSIAYSFTGISSSTDYRCNVTCSASGLSDSSGYATAIFGIPPPSCTPSFGYSSAACSSYGQYMRLAVTGTSGAINDTTTCTGTGWEDLSSTTSVILTSGTTYTATANTGSSYYSSMVCQAWIDFNDNGAMEASESVGGYNYFSAPAQTFTLTIPSGAAIGPHRMRIAGNYACCGFSPYPTMNPCPTASIAYGDVRDYSVAISAGSPSGYLTPSSVAFGSVPVSTTSSARYTVLNASYLTPASGNLTVTPPANYVICATAGGSYVNSLTIAYSGATVSSNSIYIKFNSPAAVGSYPGGLCVTGGGLSSICASITAASVLPCTGTPSPGTASTSSTTVCGSTIVTLTDAGATSGLGIGLQWQSSATGSSWTNITGATNAAYSTTLSASTYFRCMVTCSYSSLSDSTSAILVTHTSSCTYLTATPATLSFTGIPSGTTSSPVATTVAAGYLSPSAGNLTVTAPSNFEVCSTSGGTYVPSYAIAYSGATVAATSVYVRFNAPSMSGTYTGNVTIAGGSAPTANVLVTGTSVCSGTPTGGTSSASTTTACGTTSVTLTNTGHTVSSDVPLQWQESTTGSGAWTSISGATNAFYTFPGASTSMYYHLLVTCTASSSSSTSTSALVAVDRISGHIAFTSTAPDTLDMKVWLIYHNTSAGTLTAIDSTISCVDGVLPYYEFNGMGTGSYLVKARSLDFTSTMAGASGIIPTYGASNPHWDTAVTIVHTAGATDTMHIDMVAGTVPAGPGFIGGYISSGAGKNTSGDVPAVNMIVFLLDATHHVLTYTYTDASGNYSFSGVAYGSYIIYPEDLNYTTTPSALITLTTSAASATGQNFKQHTGAKTITPNMATTIKSVAHMGNDCVLFPNPATDELTINMDENAFSGIAITNNVGTQVVAMQVNRALTVLNIKDLAPGVYYIRLTGTAGTVVKKFVKM